MSCPGLTPEDYQLYALNLCEVSKAETIRAHVANGCLNCTAELSQSVIFWSRFGLLGLEDSTEQPRPELRGKVLASVAGTEVRRHPARRLFWLQAAAALLAVSALSWYLGDRGLLTPSRQTPTVVERPVASVQSKEDIRLLRERLEQAEQALAARRETAPAVRAPKPQQGAALEPTLAKAQRDLADALSKLTEQSARTAALEGELQRQRNLLAASIEERQAAAERAASLTEDRSKADERERVVRTLTSRVQQLEQQNAQYRVLIDRQQKNLERNLQVVSLLSSPSLRIARLRSTEKGAASLGYAFVDGSRVLFYAAGLPDLATGRIYQLWLIRARTPAIVSGGLFAVGNQQRAAVEFADPQLASNITALAVTEEPARGSVLPTGHKILIGSLPSS